MCFLRNGQGAARGECRAPLAIAAKPLKRHKTAMGSYWKKLAWIWVWRHVRLGLAPRRLGAGANGRLMRRLASPARKPPALVVTTPLARAAKSLKRLKTAMGSSWNKLAWIWVWRHFGLGLAPRPFGIDGTMLRSQRDKSLSAWIGLGPGGRRTRRFDRFPPTGRAHKPGKDCMRGAPPSAFNR